MSGGHDSQIWHKLQMLQEFLFLSVLEWFHLSLSTLIFCLITPLIISMFSNINSESLLITATRQWRRLSSVNSCKHFGCKCSWFCFHCGTNKGNILSCNKFNFRLLLMWKFVARTWLGVNDVGGVNMRKGGNHQRKAKKPQTQLTMR